MRIDKAKNSNSFKGVKRLSIPLKNRKYHKKTNLIFVWHDIKQMYMQILEIIMKFILTKISAIFIIQFVL